MGRIKDFYIGSQTFTATVEHSNGTTERLYAALGPQEAIGMAVLDMAFGELLVGVQGPDGKRYDVEAKLVSAH